jgi:hypothetical protein
MRESAVKPGAEMLGPEAFDAAARRPGERTADGPEPVGQARQATIRDGMRTPRPVRSFRETAFEAEPAAPRFTLGWAPSLVLNLLLLAAPFGLVIALPPVMACRERAEQFGFFAGETLASCSERGIRARIGRLDDRIKMLVRGSGR